MGKEGATGDSIVVVGNGMVGYKLCELMADTRGFERSRIVVFGEEPRPAYDRVHLTEYLSGRSVEDLTLASSAWYREHGMELVTGDAVTRIDTATRTVESASGRQLSYDRLVLATGSAPFVPPVPGHDLPGVFVYRTIEDLDRIREFSRSRQSAAVIGGGLLGLEAAKALHDLGLEAHVVEYSSRLMARQLDDAGAALLADQIRRLGVRVHTGKATESITAGTGGLAMHFGDGGSLETDMIVVSAGIRPRDELARAAGVEVAERGGIVVDDGMQTSAPGVYAVGECASHQGFVYGLVGPGYEMADVAVARLRDEPREFHGADMSTKLKLMGVDVASIGHSTAEGGGDATFVTVRDDIAGVYKRLVVSQESGALIGAVLVGDTDDYARLLSAYRAGKPLPNPPISLLVQGGDLAAAGGVGALEDDALVCTCNNVTKGAICSAVAAGSTALPEVKKCTNAATGCGGCTASVKELIELELAKAGVVVERRICPHFAFSREELYTIVRIHGLRTFEEVLAGYGSGGVGCEVCKPVLASILASAYGEPAVEHQVIQDTNDRFLGNIQRGGTYSVIPRIPGGEITPDKLIVLGEVARKYDLYVKITGGQRIDMFGARVDQLPGIWEELVAAGFESGHAYAKALRTVKSCVGSTWCRYGLLDSVGFAIRVENRYKGIRAPHKIKSAVSGCIRECAEARSKDFGIIATAEGWNLYVCGNGGATPRHADLLASGLDDETCLRLIDRFLMYYIRTAEPLTRTSKWLEALPGGIAYLREVVVDDRLGIAEALEAEMNSLVDAYRCEWAAVVSDPERRRRFQAFANSTDPDPSIRFDNSRGQKRPGSGGGLLALQQEAEAHGKDKEHLDA